MGIDAPRTPSWTGCARPTYFASDAGNDDRQPTVASKAGSGSGSMAENQPLTARKNGRIIQVMRRTKQPQADLREWQCIDTRGEEPPRPTWWRSNAVLIAGTLNTRDPGRYKVEKRKATT